jgi:flagellar hook protein FlgE
MSIQSIYTGMSGVQTMTDAMSVVGGNIANVETLGYRSCYANFQDVLSNSVSAKTSLQTGHGSSIGSVTNDFSAGDVETTSSPLDLAISGKGFFVAKQGDYDNTGTFAVSPDSDIYYTRAFHFNINKDGYLSNANGYVAQGWAYVEDDSPTANPIDIQFDLDGDTYSTEQVTSQLRIVGNLNANATDKSPGVNGLSGNWDATNYEPIPATAYDLHASQIFYDSDYAYYDTGGLKYIDVYYDKTAISNTWEYLITSRPSAGIAPTDGLLARGEIMFDGIGRMAGMTMERYSGGGWAPQSADTNTVNGHFTFSTPLGDGDIEFDIGTAYVNGTWTNDSRATTQFSAASNVTYLSSDGFNPTSSLSSVSVDTAGIITGIYSDGHQTPLYRLALATVQNPFGLSPLGKSLFMPTDTSGDTTYFTAGGRTDEYSNVAKIIPNAVERSNVEIAYEFSNMIMIQRGFQASSKGITAADQMLQTALDMKR